MVEFETIACHLCRWYEPHGGEPAQQGSCHRFPPVVPNHRRDPEEEGAFTMFPDVYRTDWCGEFQRKDPSDA